ncbi:uncharacterized protein LOC106668780 isoform X1 [Cimex lectularius]|uniref:Brain-enriched guanylate kinase-associated protein n=1 Tax=Cimex lectularius TaxID=79782 RepID=A0A8I6S0J5_CIMLE|nr:uncharacterized protein LOC106668780 isoform X1 [Cimex lectularius]
MMSFKAKTCNGCGCHCQECGDHSGLHLHVEIENLKQQLIEKENHILTMETNFLKEADKFPNGEMAAISEELLTWQDKYSRLYEAHKRVQKVNQNLEDKLLRIVDKCETEKNALTSEVSNLTKRLVDEKFNVSRLQEENERYRNDVNLAIQLLQCKPSNFVSQKYDSLPSEMQQKVRTYISSKRRQSDGNGNIPPKAEMKTIKVPIPTYPPTAMVYSVNKGTIEKDVNAEEKSNHQPVDIVSAAIMAKVLEEREKERSQTKHCDTCTCSKHKSTKSTQTLGDPPNKSISTAVLPFIKSNKLILTSNSIGVRARSVEKDKFATSDCSLLSANRNSKLNNYSDNWENESETATDLRGRKSPVGVTEGILVNIDSTENSSINSATSECSSLSWQSKMENTQTPRLENSMDSDLISFDRPLNKTNESEQRITGPRHCSVRMQAEV